MNETNIAWLFALGAAVFEALWLISLKYLDMKKLSSFKWVKFESWEESLATVLPFLGYLCFGLANVICFSLATKKIPMSVAFAVWLAVALIITTTLDLTLFDESYSWKQLLFIVMILVGVVGLKMSTT